MLKSFGRLPFYLLMLITSKENPKIKNAVRLKNSAGYRNKTGMFFLEGQRLCMDAALGGADIPTAFFTPEFAKKFPDDTGAIIKAACQTFEVTEQVFTKLSDTNSPQGVICLCSFPKFCLNPKRGGKYVILENVADPANTGAIARTAEALGLDGMFVCGGCDIYSPKALRASMGALVRFPARVRTDAVSLLDECRKAGIPCYAAVASSADCAHTKVSYANGAAVIIGNEANGVTESVKALCDQKITIPMKGRAESLNAVAAAAILIFEMTRDA